MLPLTRQYFTYGVENKWLNPVNEGQSRLSTYVGKPVRLFARILYGAVGLSVVPAAGVIYHTVKIIGPTVMAKSNESQEKKSEHVKALKEDGAIFMITLLVLATFSRAILSMRGIEPQLKETAEKIKVLATMEGVPTLSDSRVYEKMYILELQHHLSKSMAILTGGTILATPVMFALFPDRVKKL